METELFEDEVDTRDHIFTAVSIGMPDRYTIPDLPPIRSQRSIGSCASHAAIFCYEAQLNRRRFIEGSELFHYYYARKMKGSFPADTGMTIRESCKVLKNYGFAFEFLWSYNINKFNEEPGMMSRVFSKLYKTKSYERIYSFDDIKASLLMNIPILCGIFINGNFRDLDRYDFQFIPDSRSGGGHAVNIIGYDDNREMLRLRNSWGSGFGNYGYFEMSYSDFKRFSFDWWRLTI